MADDRVRVEVVRNTLPMRIAVGNWLEAVNRASLFIQELGYLDDAGIRDVWLARGAWIAERLLDELLADGDVSKDVIAGAREHLAEFTSQGIAPDIHGEPLTDYKLLASVGQASDPIIDGMRSCSPPIDTSPVFAMLTAFSKAYLSLPDRPDAAGLQTAVHVAVLAVGVYRRAIEKESTAEPLRLDAPPPKTTRGRDPGMPKGAAIALIDEWELARDQGETRKTFCNRKGIEIKQLEAARAQANRATGIYISRRRGQ